MSDNPSVISHMSIGTNDFDRSIQFYDRVLSTLGARRLLDHPGAAAYGKVYPEFWVQHPIDGGKASLGNGTHLAFFASSQSEVDAFFAAAVLAGGRADGKPGPRSEYGAPYYGCFVRDPDGHKIEATHWDLSKGPAGEM